MDIAAQAAAALAAAHAHGIVHRDLKPENLFLIPDPSQRSHVRVKVLDFGIAKLQRRLSGQSIRTHTGSIMGTPPYMSPEQCRGISSEIDQRTDIYAMGIILYEMLTGAPPFLSEGFGDVLLMHLTQPPRPPREIDPTIPPSLEKLVLQALEKEPERRLADMGELLHGLIGPAARTTVRQGVDPNDPQYAETDVIPRLRAGSSGARRTTFSSTASQLMGDTERLSVRRKRLAVGTGRRRCGRRGRHRRPQRQPPGGTAGLAGAPGRDQAVGRRGSTAHPRARTGGARRHPATSRRHPSQRQRPTTHPPRPRRGRRPRTTWRPRRIRPPRPPAGPVPANQPGDVPGKLRPARRAGRVRPRRPSAPPPGRLRVRAAARQARRSRDRAAAAGHAAPRRAHPRGRARDQRPGQAQAEHRQVVIRCHPLPAR